MLPPVVEPPVLPPVVEPPVLPPVVEPPVLPPVVEKIVIVDKNNSYKALSETAYRSFKLLDLYQSAVDSLANVRCQMGENDYCAGVFSQFNSVNNNSRVATGLFGSIRIKETNWIAGASINYPNYTQLIDNYNTRGTTKPGVGVFSRYQENTDGDGLSVDISAAYVHQSLSISRDKLKNTEAGIGDSGITAYQVGIKSLYGIRVNKRTKASYISAINHHRVMRNGYTETRHAEFPASYSSVGNTKTDLQLGLSIEHAINRQVSFDGHAGVKVKLHEKHNDFSGEIENIGSFNYNKTKVAIARPYIKSNINLSPTSNSVIKLSAGFERSDYANDSIAIGVDYSYRW